MTTFTSGIWQAESDGEKNNRTFYVTDYTGLEVICECYTNVIGTHAKAKENARLIQAAPDLLKAVKMLLEKAPPGSYSDSVREKAEKAVYKARKGSFV